MNLQEKRIHIILMLFKYESLIVAKDTEQNVNAQACN